MTEKDSSWARVLQQKYVIGEANNAPPTLEKE